MPSAAPIPPPLAEALAMRKVILFAGAGMSMPPLPGWSDLLKEMLAKALADKAAGVMRDEAAINADIAAGKNLAAAELLRRGMGERDFCDYLKIRIGQARGDERHQIAARLPFAAILTTNFDSLLEDAFPPLPARPAVIRQNQPTELTRAANKGEFCVIHVHGDVTDSKSIVLAAADYAAVKKDRQIAHCIQTLSATRTFLFVGYGLGDEDLLLFLEEVFGKARGNTPPHYVLDHACKITQARRDEFDRKYGIRFLEDSCAGKHADIRSYLLALEATLPVPEDAAQDAIKLFEEWGCTAIERVASEGRLLLRAIKQDKFNRDEHLALGYVHRAPQQADIEAVAALGGADDRILVSHSAAGAGLGKKGVNVFTRDEFIDTLISFRTYRPNIETAYLKAKDKIDNHYIPLRARPYQQKQPRDLDEIIDEWLADQSGKRRHLSILGEFGTGKSWFSRRLNYRAAHAKGRTPILIQLRQWAERFNVPGLITSTLEIEHGLRAAHGIYPAFERLNREGRLLLIFDGFDEMVRNANNSGVATDNFNALAALAKEPRAKVLLTCRTEYFASESHEEKTVMGRHATPTKPQEDWIKGREGFECVHLELFTDEQVGTALKKRGHPGLFEKLKGHKSLFEFAHRAQLLDMLVDSRQHWEDQDNVTLAGLYGGYTGTLLELHPGEVSTTDDRRNLLEDAAWDMQTTQRFEVKSTDFEEIVRRRFKQIDSEQMVLRLNDLQSQSSYFRREGDLFNWAHRSFLEYFVAVRLARELLSGVASAIPITDVIVEFLPDLMAAWTPKIEDDGQGMVKISAGPFVYGSEEAKNLRVAVLDHDFWIDKNPVTNTEFLGFLKKHGKRGTEEWIYPEPSKIGPKMNIQPGFETHPVTGVTWYGATAYAEAAGKRLPSELEWEKSARGIDGRPYPWHGPFDASKCNVETWGVTTPAGSLPAGVSPYGALDMAGNVWEWIASDNEAYRGGKALRGGWWEKHVSSARCAFQCFLHPGSGIGGIGFRCART